MRDDLLMQLKLKHMNYVANAPETELQKRIKAAENAMPVSVLDRITKQLTEMLPAAEKKYGTEHATYLFYVEMVMVCIWCNRYMGLVEDHQYRYSNLKLENTVLRERLLEVEKQLSRFETAEDIIMNGSIDNYMRVVIDRIGHNIPDHPRVQAFANALDIIQYPKGNDRAGLRQAEPPPGTTTQDGTTPMDG